MFENNEQTTGNLLEAREESSNSSSSSKRKRSRRDDTSSFQCPQCHRIFGRIEHLRRHANSHGEARSFKCLACGKGFNRLDTLQRHELIHQKDPGVSKLKGARACRECASSKVRCNGTIPCERCSSKNTDCVYPSAASPSQAQDSPSSGISDTISTPGAIDTVPSSLLESASFPRQLEQSLPHVSYAPPFSEHQNLYLPDTWAYNSTSELVPQSSSLVQVPHPSFGYSASPHESNAHQLAFSPFEGSYSGTEASFEIHYSSPAPRDRHASLDQLSRRPRLIPSLRSKTAILDSDSPIAQIMAPISQEAAPRDHSDMLGSFSRSFAQTPTYLSRRRRFNFPLSGDILPTFQADVYLTFDLLPAQTYFDIHRSFLSVCTGLTAYHPPYGSSNFPSKRIFNAFIKLYLERFHSIMPILHYPTLDLEESHWILSLAIATIGSHMADFEQSEEYCLCLDEFLRRAIVALDSQEAIDRTTICQAKLLACIVLIYSGDEAWQESAYNDYHPDLLNFCRLDWKREGPDLTSHVSSGQETGLWKQWAAVESRRRTGYAIWMLDAMWAYQFQVQPKLALEDALIPLPCQEVLWEAKTASQWHHVFQFSLSNLSVLSAMQLLEDQKTLQHTLGEFSRIILVHGFYHRSWEMERTAMEPQSLVHRVPNYTIWRESVSDWLAMLQLSAHDVVNAASGMEHPTILHLHLARIVLFAPFRSICDLAYGMTKEDTSISVVHMTELRRTIRKWVMEDERKARLAALHAGAIFRHLQHFHTGGFYEPSAVLLATLTLWAYGAFTNTSMSAPSLQRRYSDTQRHPVSITLDQQIEPELARLFVKEGRDMAPTLGRVGSIRGNGGAERVLLEGSKLVSEIGRWGSGRKVMRILNNLSLCRSI